MSYTDSRNSFAESGYDSGTWQARHAIAKGVIIIFSIIFLAFKGGWGAVTGFFSSIAKGWKEDVKPLFRKH